MKEQIVEYLRSQDRDIVAIGIELLNDVKGVLDKESILKESGLTNMLTSVWRKDYIKHYTFGKGRGRYYKSDKDYYILDEKGFRPMDDIFQTN